jgi:hypothetical protein
MTRGGLQGVDYKGWTTRDGQQGMDDKRLANKGWTSREDERRTSRDRLQRMDNKRWTNYTGQTAGYELQEMDGKKQHQLQLNHRPSGFEIPRKFNSDPRVKKKKKNHIDSAVSSYKLTCSFYRRGP